MVVQKRCLLWDYTNTNECPGQMDQVNFSGPISSVSNWNAWVPPELKGRVPFRPMIHLERELNGNEWQWIQDSDQPIIHFFNEPERNGIDPQKAADYWHNQVIPNLRNQRQKQLVSPSCASDPNGQNWIAEWMNLVQDCAPEFLGIHWYGTSADEAKRYIEDMHNKFPNQKIIVSEIACISRDGNECYQFTRDMCNWLDGQDYVFEYAFFGCMKNMPDDYR
ncbi:glycoside hydrolase family 128 protein [Periconia macrospinosa]|uniref:Glycoside hydrolase family 128 protein n=1 Tax=Periconia macrospinosa TaxID=97972 RepID=A0A2V1DYI1_9PLEO|nr:glycoside hydrolase family 128 protein [Periconia macrospinosa]